MFSAITTFLGNGLSAVFELFGSSMTGFIGLIWASPDGGVGTESLTPLGELMLMGAVVGLALFGIKFVRRMIPFMK